MSEGESATNRDPTGDTPMYCTKCKKNVQRQSHCPKGGNHHLLSISDKGVQGQGHGDGPESTRNSKESDPHKVASVDPNWNGKHKLQWMGRGRDARGQCSCGMWAELGTYVMPSKKVQNVKDKFAQHLQHAQDHPEYYQKEARVAHAQDRIRYHAMQYLAHDSGDGQTVYHCPFCGGGNVIGRSDGTIECGFCNTHFTVQVQPEFAGMPQTIDGQPYDVPGMPGGVDPNTGLPPEMGEDQEMGDEEEMPPEGAEMGSPEDEEAQGKNGSSVPWEHQSAKKTWTALCKDCDWQSTESRQRDAYNRAVEHERQTRPAQFKNGHRIQLRDDSKTAAFSSSAGLLTEGQYMAHLALLHSVVVKNG